MKCIAILTLLKRHEMAACSSTLVIHSISSSPAKTYACLEAWPQNFLQSPPNTAPYESMRPDLQIPVLAMAKVASYAECPWYLRFTHSDTAVKDLPMDKQSAHSS